VILSFVFTWTRQSKREGRKSSRRFRDRIGDGRFSQFGFDTIESVAAENPGKHVLVDVGAGFLNGPFVSERLKRYRVISLEVEKEIGYARLGDRPGLDFSMVDYEGTIRHIRSLLQDKPYLFVDTSVDPPNRVAAKVLEYLRRIWD